MRTVTQVDYKEDGGIAVKLDGTLIEIVEATFYLFSHLSDESGIPFVQLCDALKMYGYDEAEDSEVN